MATLCSGRVVLAEALVLTVSLGACGGRSGGTSNPTSPAMSTPPPTPPTTVSAAGDNWSFRTEGFSGIGITGTLAGGAPLAALEGSVNPSGDAITAVLNMHILFVLVTGTCPELSLGDGRLVRQ